MDERGSIESWLAAPNPPAEPDSSPQPVAPPEPDQSIEAWLDDGKTETANRLGAAYQDSLSKNPDSAAQALRINRETGVSPDTAESNLAELNSKRDAFNFPAEQYAREAPKVAEWAAQSPQHAAAVRDDLDRYAEIERLISDRSMLRSMYEALNAGSASIFSQIAKTPALVVDTANLVPNLVLRSMGEPQLQSPAWLRKNAATDYWDEKAKAWSPPEFDASLWREIESGNYARAGRVLAVQATAQFPQLMGLVAANLAGAIHAGLAGMGVAAAADKNVESQAALPNDPAAATANALAQGGAEAVFESLGTGGILSKWEMAIANRAGKGVSREVFKDFAKTLAHSFLAEGTEEVATEVFQSFSDWVTGVNPEALKGLGERAINVFALGGAMGVGMTSPAGIGLGLSRVRAERQAQMDRDFYVSLGQSAEAAKLRERLPEAQREIVERVTKDTPVENVFIPVGAFEEYFQGAGVNPVKAAQEIGISQEYEDAKLTGAEVKVPLAQWAEKVIGTPHYQGLSNDIKFDPNDLTVNEHKAEKQEIERLAKESAGAVPQKEAPGIEQSAQQIGQGIAKQLETAGTDPTEAIIIERFANTMGQAFGVDPAKLLPPLQVRRADGSSAPAQASLEQTAFHGSPHKFEKFSLQEIGTGEGVQSYGYGLYFTSSKDVAKYYRETLSDGPGGGRLYTVEIPEPTAFLPWDEKLSDLPKNQKIALDQINWLSNLKQLPRGVEESHLEALSKALWRAQRYSNDPEYKDMTVGDAYKEAINELTDSFSSSDDEHADASRGLSAVLNAVGFPGIRYLDGVSRGGNGDTYNYVVFDERLVQIKGYEQSALPPGGASRSARVGIGQTEVALPESVAVTRATSAPLGQVPIENTPEFHDDAAAIARKSFQGKRFTNAHTGWEIEISNKGLKKSRHVADSVAHSVAMNHLPELIKNAVFAEREAPKDAERKNNIRAHLVFYAPMRFQEKDYVVRLGVRETAEGKRFYEEAVIENEGPAGITDLTVSGENPDVNGPLRLPIQQFLDQLNAARQVDEYFQNAPPFFQNDARGRILFLDRSALIELGKSADRSTFLHESAHYFLEAIRKLVESPDAPERLKADFAKIREYLKAEEGTPFTREQHETFARSFEAYLMEGKAPSSALRRAFAQFRVWLLTIYRELSGLGVELTPEIRGVFDRMLATDEEIASARAELGMPPADSPNTFGMTGADAQKWIEARDAAALSATEEMQRRLMDDIRKQQSAQWKAREKELRKTVTDEVNQERVYRALSVLRTGKFPDGTEAPAMKLSRDALYREFKEDLVKKLPTGITSRDGGVHPSIAAESFGFRNATEMIVQLAAAEKKADLIARLVDERLRGEFGDLLSQGDLTEEAKKAIHNEGRAKLLRLEMDFLAQKRTGDLKRGVRALTKTLSDRVIREQGVRVVASTTIRELNPTRYLRAAQKARKEAGTLFTKGDFDAAFEAKKREALNEARYRAAIDAREEVEKATVLLKRFRRSDADLAKTRDMNLINAGRAILSRFGMGPEMDDTPEGYLAFMKEYDPDQYQAMSAIVSSATLNARPWREATYQQVLTMRDALQAVWDVSREVRTIEIEGRKADQQEAVDALTSRFAELSSGKGPPIKGLEATKGEKRRFGLLGIRSMLRRVESWVDSLDGGRINGALRRYIWNPVSDAINHYRIERGLKFQELEAVLAPWKGTLGRREILAPELGDRVKFDNRAQLLGALLHTGNDSNLSKLLRGRGWGELNEDGTLNRSRWDAFINRMIDEGVLTKTDFDTVQKVWDLFEGLKPQSQRAHKQMYGYYFNEITATPFVNKLGSYRGGYYPAIVDPYLSRKMRGHADEEALLKGDNSFMFPTTGRGFTKERVEAFAAPLIIDLNLAKASLDRQLRFIHVEPVVKGVGRLLWNPQVRAAIDGFDASALDDMLIPWLQRAARQEISRPGTGSGGRALDTFYRELRRRTGLQALALNVTNALQQLTGFLPALAKVKRAYLQRAIWTYTRSPAESRKWIAEKSEFMRVRTDTQLMEVAKNLEDLVIDPSRYERTVDFVQKHGYILQRVFQDFVDAPVWMGAYDQAIAQGVSEADAIHAADAAVRLTQGSLDPESVSRAEGGPTWARLFTMFMSYFNTLGNLLGSESAIPVREMGLVRASPRLLFLTVFVLMMPAILSKLITELADGSLDDDDDGYMDEFLAIFFGAPIETAAAMVPGGSMAYRGLTGDFLKNNWGDRITLSPVETTLVKALRTPYSGYKALFEDGSWKKAATDALALVALVGGVPTGPVARPLGYLLDVSEGKAQPENAVDFARGLVTGRSGEANR